VNPSKWFEPRSISNSSCVTDSSSYQKKPMTGDKLNTSLLVNIITAKLTNHFQGIRGVISSTDKHYSLDSEDGFRSGCRNSTN